ncbi:alpha/beta hydrolase [Candidatus Margulisiibacteriota bacterium]
MKHKEYNYFTKDNIKIYCQAWIPDKPTEKLICFIHGLGEHSGRYKHVGKYFADHGYIFAAFDRRGNGKSKGRVGHLPSYDIFMDDIDRFIETTSIRHNNPSQIILYGHSFGGGTVLNYTIRKKPEVTAIIASSPAIMIPFIPHIWHTIAGRVCNYIFPIATGTTTLNSDNLSRDLAIQEDVINDPLNHSKMTAKTFCLSLDTGEWLLDHTTELHVPTLVMHGTEDHLTEFTATVEFAKRAGDICTLKLWKNYYHELHNDIGKEKVFKYTKEWLDKIL